MNGADTLVGTLLASGVDTCFANPGTSEMHFVAALDANPDMRCVLCLFEGGVTGAADGYARMSGGVAATLLHLAPGFGNGHANLHNASKAGVGIVNVVGDHAQRHLRYEAPLKGDIEGVAGSVSSWVRRAAGPESVARDAAEAVAAARSGGGRIATLILPADAAWGAAEGAAKAPAPPPLLRPDPAQVAAAADALRRPGAALVVSGPGLHGAPAEDAGRIAAATGCRLIAPFFAPRLRGGAGAPAVERMQYVVEENSAFFDGVAHMVLVGADRPVNFFAYPGKPSTPEPPGATHDPLCPPGWDVAWTLAALVDAVGPAEPRRNASARPEAPTGPITPQTVGAAVARALPDETVIVNEAVTAGLTLAPALRGAPPHDLLSNTGGAIGMCLPLAVGAAVAAPGRRVLALTGDGSAMYTLQSLWTMARERLDVTVVVFANRGYRILRLEMANLGVTDYGRNAQRMFDVEDPSLDWQALACGHGVPSERVETAEALEAAIARASATPGPTLIEAVMAS
ncbi:acetolactate synthase large subunit [Rhodobacteraceae bacterium CCMM004]|nr:acetolactate synthase large subunit [Rhodobacteraceae bacterium CCMM004]